MTGFAETSLVVIVKDFIEWHAGEIARHTFFRLYTIRDRKELQDIDSIRIMHAAVEDLKETGIIQAEYFDRMFGDFLKEIKDYIDNYKK